MPNRAVQKICWDAGYKVYDHPFEHYDTLANSLDLNALFDVLIRFRDAKGAHPVITANSVVANPDFDKIAYANYEKYHYEPFVDTLKRYYPNENVFDLWKEGISAGVFYPQYHNREHFNVPLWMSRLQSKDDDALFSFGLRMVGITSKKGTPNYLMEALNTRTRIQMEWTKESIQSGAYLFHEIFGYYSDTFIAPCYIWSDELNHVLSENGVKVLQGGIYQILPHTGKQIKHYMGERNAYEQIYTIRNCVFEPSLMGNKCDAVSKCMSHIANAFMWHKPAVITSHRLNYIGTLDERNRTENLGLLNDLLSRIIKKWPDVEFMTTSQLRSLLIY